VTIFTFYNISFIPSTAIAGRIANYIAEASGTYRWTVPGEVVGRGFGYVMHNCRYPAIVLLDFHPVEQ